MDDPVRAALAARERQVAELRAQLAGERERADRAEVVGEHHRASAQAAGAEAAAQRERAEAREAELVNAHAELLSVHAALEAQRARADAHEASRSFRLARALRRVRSPRG